MLCLLLINKITNDQVDRHALPQITLDDNMRLISCSLLLVIVLCDGDRRLDLKNCKYKDNACIGIKMEERTQIISMNASEGCLRTSTCGIILRGTVESHDKISWILRIALKFLHSNRLAVYDIYTNVRFGVESDPLHPIHVEFNSARVRTSSLYPTEKDVVAYEPYGESLVVKSGGSAKAHSNQSVYYLKSFWPKSISNKTQYFYVYFWSRSIISYTATANNEVMSYETNLIQDYYYVYLYHWKCVPHVFTSSATSPNITSLKVNLFKDGIIKPKNAKKESTDSDSSTILLIVLLVVIIFFTSAIAILLVTCWLNRGKGPVSMETQPKLGGKTFQSSDTTTATKDIVSRNRINGQRRKRDDKNRI